MALRHRRPGADRLITDLTSDQAVAAVVAGDLDRAVMAAWHHLYRELGSRGPYRRPMP